MDSGLSRLLPLLFLAFIWVLTSSSRGKKKSQNPSGTGKPETTRPGAAAGKALKADPFRNKEQEVRTETVSVSSGSGKEAGVLSASGIGYGSLGGVSQEGLDPCHDEPYRIPSGSLSAHSEEGEDPCHDDWKPAVPAVSAQENVPQASSGGLNLNWTGSEIVKGFVYGEILNRKVG